MASLDIKGLDVLMAHLDKIGRFDEVAPKMLDAAVPILEAEVQKGANQHIASGDMASSIQRTGATAGEDGSYYISVRPTGKDRKGVDNMAKAVWLEYGVKGRPASPFLSTAVLNATPKVIAKMREVYWREMSK